MAPDDRVSVVLTGGRLIKHAPVAHAKGSWQRPLTREELKDKFLDCTTRRLGRDHAAALFDQLWNVTQLASARELRLTALPGSRRVLPSRMGPSDTAGMGNREVGRGPERRHTICPEARME
jgi:hypothetical protein